MWRTRAAWPHSWVSRTTSSTSATTSPPTWSIRTWTTTRRVARPNPCVECNRAIKFGRLLDRAHALGFDLLATGHHARVLQRGERYELARGVDGAKDQSYVLYMLGQRELARSVFPVGEFTKADVRAHAARLGLRTADKPESMDVCFVQKGARVRFLDEREPMRPGDVVDSSGTVLGAHPGVAAFTIGQRRGLGVATGERSYVVDIDTSTATVTLGSRAELLRDDVTVCGLTFVDGVPGDSTLLAQVRAHGDPIPASLDGNVVRFAEPQPRVARGQVVALYHGNTVVGGGIAA